ncbi:MAG: hypothetical protein R6V12_16590 [Candidatus Hydrogenedentota bacterium]
MRSERERVLDMLEAIDRIERYARKAGMFSSVTNSSSSGLCITWCC